MDGLIRNNVGQGKFALQQMLEGIKTGVDAIRPTYGHKGFNAVIQSELYPYHQVANDAQTIIQAIECHYPFERRGLGFLKELMDKSDKDSGDGRKTTAIIAEEIIERGYHSGLNGMELKRELDSFIPLIEQELDKNKEKISVKDIHKVAQIAGESEEIGKLLGEVYAKVGAESLITSEPSGTYRTSVDYGVGVRFQRTGYLSPFMAYDEEAQKEKRKEVEAIYQNPLILVTKRKIEKDTDIGSLVDKSVELGRGLVIFTDDMDSGVASRLIATHRAKIAKILIIKAPTLWKNYVFEDFAKCTGATIVEDSSGITFKNLPLNALGTCAKIVVDKDDCVITGTADISEHLQQLEKEGSEDSKIRLSMLRTNRATIKIGGNNESELSYKRLKIKDAINASYLALKDGVVAGGGVALYQASEVLPDTQAGNLLKLALQAPHRQLCENAQLEIPSTFGEEIIDSCAVIKNAVRNAIALASTVLTCGIVIVLPPKPEQSLRDRTLNF